MGEKKLYTCPHHCIKYKRWDDYNKHQKEECELWLTRKNVCTYLKNGKACGVHFSETANLILHYFKIHDLYACTCCFDTFKNSKDLEDHAHSYELNVRLSKLILFCCVTLN